MASLSGMGTGDKKKVAVAAGLGVVVLALAAHTIFGGPSSTPVAPVQPASLSMPAPGPAATRSRAASGAAASAASTSNAATASIDPDLHPELMAENENYLYTGHGRNIFSQTSGPPPAAIAIEKVRGPVRPSAQQIAASAAPPGPPAINLKFFGYAARRNGTRRAFLLHDDDVFVASEGDVVSHRYRVVKIAPFSIEVEDLPYHDTQTLPLVQVQN